MKKEINTVIRPFCSTYYRMRYTIKTCFRQTSAISEVCSEVCMSFNHGPIEIWMNERLLNEIQRNLDDKEFSLNIKTTVLKQNIKESIKRGLI